MQQSQIYQEQIAKSNEVLSGLKQKSNQVIWLRVLSFLMLTFLVVWSLYFKEPFALWFIPIPLIIFLLLIKRSNHLKLLKNIQLAIIEVNQNELKVLNGEFSQFSNGKAFQESNHDYAHDMDLFGEKSIFQYINRTTSNPSEQNLAQYFNQFETNKFEIKKRQEAIKELTSQVEWRQKFLANGKVFKPSNESLKGLSNWIENGIDDFDNTTLWNVLVWLTPVYAIAVVTLSSLGFYSAVVAIILLNLPLGIVGRKLKLINHHHTASSRYLEDLKKNKVLATLIEEKEFTSPKLKEIKQQLFSEDKKASTKIGELSAIVEALDNRSNPLFAFLANAFMLWDIKYMLQMKKWLNNNKVEVEKWFHAVYEMEAYLSFSNYAFNHQAFVYPTLSEENPIKAKGLGHPLIFGGERIDNDYELASMKQFTIITGANMAGKSTFLRSVGVNLVIGMCGAPVCAKEFEFMPLRLFSSMRTADSLSDSESYFYAELKRLKSIVDELKAGEKLFVILDEILKGTNSKDKAEGSKKFVTQLIKHDLAGIIATHDLSLCSLEQDYPNNIQNKYFDVEIVNDELDFDYKLKAGICSNMNAEYLMKKMGITE